MLECAIHPITYRGKGILATIVKITIDENQEEQPRIPAVLLGFCLYYFFSRGFQLDRKTFSPKPTARAHADAHAVPWVARTAAIPPRRDFIAFFPSL